MYTIKSPSLPKNQTFEKLKDARKAGISFFPNVTLTNKKGVVLPLM